MSALKGIVVVEIATRICGEWTGRLLADHGAEVIKVEPPGGSPTRSLGLVAPGDGGMFAYANTGKKSVVFDLAQPADRSALDLLLARAQALIDDHDEAWCAALALDPASVRSRHPHLVHCQITPFGQGAPADRQRALPLNIAAAGGWAWHSPGEGQPEDEPLMGAGPYMPDFESGMDAAIATTASLLRQRRTGQGQSIDLSEAQVQLSRADVVIGRMLAGDDEPSQSRRRYDMGGPGDAFACADGFVHLVMMTRVHWNGLRQLMGDPEWTSSFREDWLEFDCTPANVAAFRDAFRPWIAQQLRNEISAAAQALGVPLVPVNNAADLVADPQYRHRGFFQPVTGPAGGELQYPTGACRMTASPAWIGAPAPLLDANRGELPL